MILKLWRYEDKTDSAEPGSWFLFDGIARLRYGDTRKQLFWDDDGLSPVYESLSKWTGIGETNRLHVQLDGNTHVVELDEFGNRTGRTDTDHPYFVARWFQWLDAGTEDSHLLVTNASVVYVMSDLGETVETLR